MTKRPHILFVDDEPRVLGGLRRLLRTQRDRWEMVFVEGGVAALETLRAGHYDVVVSDYRMPEMDGAELLERVRVDSPTTAGVILSGQTNDDNLPQILTLADEFIDKPSTPDEIVAVLERLLAAGRPGTGPTAPEA